MAPGGSFDIIFNGYSWWMIIARYDLLSHFQPAGQDAQYRWTWRYLA